MKGLNQFNYFAWMEFAKGKTFLVTGCGDLIDDTTKEVIGTKVDTVIEIDDTPYKFKDGEVFTNRFEKVTFKSKNKVDIPINSRVIPVNAVATIYGEYRNQLSVKCDDIQIVNPKEK